MSVYVNRAKAALIQYRFKWIDESEKINKKKKRNLISKLKQDNSMKEEYTIMLHIILCCNGYLEQLSE